MKDLVWNMKRSSIAERVLEFLPSDDFNSGVDWSATKAYYIGNEGGTIYLNMTGREPDGVVIRGPESKAVALKLLSAAREITDPATGKPVVGQAFESTAFYTTCISDAPDVLLVENESYAFSGRYNYARNLFSDVEVRFGDHSMEGILFMGGDGVLPRNIHGASVWDITPTILYLLGIPIPDHIDGKIIGEALEDHPSDQVSHARSPSPETEHITKTIERLKESGKI